MMMKEHYLTLMERRLVTLRRLARDLEDCRAAHVALDLQAMNSHSARQENLCAEVRAIDAELEGLRRGFAGELAKIGSSAKGEAEAPDPEFARRQLELISELKVVQSDLKDQCRIHSGLLRRSRRSTSVLLNFIAHYSGQYPIPEAPTGARRVQT